MKRISLLLCLFISIKIAFSQNTIGIPTIFNHTKQDYRAGSQNWDVKQDATGIVYFANNDGLLSYDGTFWRLYPLPNKVIARSLAIGDDGNIYIGGQEEFGYFSPGKAGELVYTSLKNRLSKQDKDFADVWNVCVFKNEVFFRSNKKIFKYSNNSIAVYNNTNWGFLGSNDNEVITYDYEKGLVAYRNGQWVTAATTGKLPDHIKLSSFGVIGNDSLLISSFTDGLFLLHNSTITKFESPYVNGITTKNISGIRLLEPDRIAVITNLAGCIIINKKGEFIQRFSKKEGLQNNNIICMLSDKDKNLWMGLDNGIDMVAYNNAITNIFPEPDDRNSGYTSLIYKNNLYLGVSTGLYTIPLDKSKDLSFVNGQFKFIENTNGQVWSINEVNGQLLMGHNNGAYVIKDGKAVGFDNKTGFWTFMPLYNTTPSPIVIAGTYNGINVYDYNNGNFLNPKKHAQFESAKFVVLDDSVIWIAHSYKGLFKVTLDSAHKPTSTIYNDKKKILSANHNHLFRVKNKIVLTNDNGIFEYNPKEKDFVRSEYFEKLFDYIPISYLKEDSSGNLWFCRDKKLGVIDMSGLSPRTIYIPELDNKITAGSYEHINIIDNNNVLIASEKGFFHINYALYKKNKYPLHVLLRNVISTTKNNGLLFGGYASSDSAYHQTKIKYKGNSLHFEYSSTLYAQAENIEYSYYLKGFDKGWSPWITKTEKDYTNLPEGDYVFQIKCRNSIDNESAVVSYSFTILPPWYRSFVAYASYIILLCLLLYFFYKRQQEKYKRLQLIKLKEQQRQYDEEQKHLQFLHQLEINKNEKEIINLKNEKLQAEIEQKNLEEEQQRLQFLHQIEVEKNEKEIINLKNEKLQADIELKNQELASGAMSLVQKGELLSTIKEELMRLKNNSEIEKDSKDFKKVIRIIDNQLDNTHDWDQFAVHFDSVHTNYLKNLKDRFPDLTASELKLCAYLRLNLSTKEIAQLMNISVRGVETSRYRLRKKLDLANEVNLFDFLLTVAN